MQRYFQSRLQRALAWYAIVPVLVITLLGTALMLASWQRSVVQANEEAREAAAEALSEAGREFLQRTGEAAEFLGAVPDFPCGGRTGGSGPRPWPGCTMTPAAVAWLSTCWMRRAG